MSLEKEFPLPPQIHVWTLPVEGCLSNDWQTFQRRLLAAAAQRGLRQESIGTAFGQPLWLLTNRRTDAPRKLLIASGFHGEESAGPWAVLRVLETADSSLFARADISFIPLVNVSGFSTGTRFNTAGENPNRGFRAELDAVPPSAEGRLLLAQSARIAALGRDGVLACHEDIDVAGGYVYAYERTEAPGRLGVALRDANAQFFACHPDGVVDGCTVRDGIVFNHYDSSFESWAMTAGATFAACTETPGLQPIEARIRAHAAMIEAFVRHASVVANPEVAAAQACLID
jgi:predicted deacylase